MTPRKLIAEGIRVLDLGMFWAGPIGASLLADAGMEVIKIEACKHPDPDRITPQGLAYVNNDPGKDPWNRGLITHRRHRNKLGFALDCSTLEGREIFLKLVLYSDIIMENFRYGVMDRWGLGYPVLKQANPRIIQMSLSSSGYTGPDRNHGANASITACLGGMVSTTGYPGETSEFVNSSLPDPMAGTIAAGLVIAGLRERNRTGKGMHIILSQRELVSNVLGEFFMDYFMNGRVAGYMGNRHQWMAPQGCYPCQGDDSWITLVIRNDGEWNKFCKVMGVDALAADSRFTNGLSRLHNQDDLDVILTNLFKTRDKHEVTTLLQSEGVAAGMVANGEDMVHDPHLRARGFWETAEHPGIGSCESKSRGFYFSKCFVGTRLAAPNIGEHNSYVLGSILGMSSDEIARLEEKGIIGTAPTPDVQSRIPAFGRKTGH